MLQPCMSPCRTLPHRMLKKPMGFTDFTTSPVHQIKIAHATSPKSRNIGSARYKVGSYGSAHCRQAVVLVECLGEAPNGAGFMLRGNRGPRGGGHWGLPAFSPKSCHTTVQYDCYSNLCSGLNSSPCSTFCTHRGPSLTQKTKRALIHR